MISKSTLHLCAFGVLAWAQAPLSLEEATARALANNRQILQGRATVQIRKADAAIARTKRWPSLSTSLQAGPLLNRPAVTFPMGAFGTYDATGPIPGSDMKVSIPRKVIGFSTAQISVPLLQQRRLGLGVQSADLDTRAAGEQVASTEKQTVAQVRNLYFQIVALEAARVSAASQVRVAEEVVRLAQKGVEEGTSLPSERLEAQTKLIRAKADAADLEADIQNGQEQLNLLMGAAADARYQFATTLPVPSALTLEDARAQAAANRPEIREGRLRVEQAELAMRSKKLEWIPDASLAVTEYGLVNTGNIAPSQLALASVTVNWEPWDWGRKKHEMEAARERKEQAGLALKQAEAQAEFEVGRAFREWERAQRDKDAARQEVLSAAESLRVARQRYEQQAALLRVVLEAQTAWETAGQKAARAAAAAGTAWADLQLALGAE